jgi:hypothetical protein
MSILGDLTFNRRKSDGPDAAAGRRTGFGRHSDRVRHESHKHCEKAYPGCLAISTVTDSTNEGGLALTFENHTWFYPAVAPAELPIGLKHLDSDFCWCDPTIEVDENGNELVIHRQVTWN